MIDFNTVGTDNNLHDLRWYEVQANRLTSRYFDRHFGSGSDGYVPGSLNHFDVNSFVNDRVISPYGNPQGGRNSEGNPLQSSYHWSDLPINVVFNTGIGLIGYL